MIKSLALLLSLFAFSAQAATLNSFTLNDAAEKTGGNKDVTGTSDNHTLTIAEMPLHGHPSRTGGDAADDNQGSFGLDDDKNVQNRGSYTGTPNNTLGNQIGGEGGGGAHSHGISLTDEALQPYITVYMWKRTA